MSGPHIERMLRHMTEQWEQGTLVLPRKVLCRNSYERRVVHQWAQTIGLSHATTMDYSNMHKNRRDEEGMLGYTTLVYSKTPHSFITLSKPDSGRVEQPKVIGEPKAFHPTHRRVYSSGVYWSDKKVFSELQPCEQGVPQH